MADFSIEEEPGRCQQNLDEVSDEPTMEMLRCSLENPTKDLNIQLLYKSMGFSFANNILPESELEDLSAVETLAPLPIAVPTGVLPLVGCSCGKPGGLKRVTDNSSSCTWCKRLQCLQCGEDFATSKALERHLNRKDHLLNEVEVTTEHKNRPLDQSPTWKPHSSDIQLLHCGMCKFGDPERTYKLGQYLSKCLSCESYICLVCGYAIQWYWDIELHNTRVDHHVQLSDAANKNNTLAKKWCPTCKKEGSAKQFWDCLRETRFVTYCKCCHKEL